VEDFRILLVYVVSHRDVPYSYPISRQLVLLDIIYVSPQCDKIVHESGNHPSCPSTYRYCDMTPERQKTEESAVAG
jgi:hypothetical protein